MSNLGSDLPNSNASSSTSTQNFITTGSACGSSASSEQNGPGSLSSNSSKRQQKLRRPNPETLTRLLCDLAGSGDMSSSQHTFSVDAPVFVPRQNTPAEKSNLSVAACEFVPRSTAGTHSSQDQELDDLPYEEFQRLVSIRPAHLISSSAEPSHSYILDEFKNILFMLTSHPGNVEEFLMTFTEKLSSFNDQTILTNIIEMLFEQSVTESNFRYTGARICKYLSKNLKAHPSYNNFRALFLKRCKTEFDKRDALLSSEADISRLCGLTLFVGELFVHLEAESDGKTTKIKILMIALNDLLLTLLNNPVDATVKCAAQLLKFCGAALEDSCKEHEKAAVLDKVFNILRSLSGNTTLGKTSQMLINSVLSLRDSDWGRKDLLSAADIHLNSGGYPCTFEEIEPVFYDQHGQQITREEAGFSQEVEDTFAFTEYELNDEEQEAYDQWQEDTGYGTWSNNVDYYNEDFASGDMNNENYIEDFAYMGEEEEAAYEDFLRSQVNHQ